MFFVNGESYDWGSGGSLDGTILSSLSRVIVVTLNYRLGLFGEKACILSLAHTHTHTDALSLPIVSQAKSG